MTLKLSKDADIDKYQTSQILMSEPKDVKPDLLGKRNPIKITSSKPKTLDNFQNKNQSVKNGVLSKLNHSKTSHPV